MDTENEHIKKKPTVSKEGTEKKHARNSQGMETELKMNIQDTPNKHRIHQQAAKYMDKERPKINHKTNMIRTI